MISTLVCIEIPGKCFLHFIWGSFHNLLLLFFLLDFCRSNEKYTYHSPKIFPTNGSGLGPGGKSVAGRLVLQYHSNPRRKHHNIITATAAMYIWLPNTYWTGIVQRVIILSDKFECILSITWWLEGYGGIATM